MKRATRERRRKRRDLVHAAGCVFRCVVRDVVFSDIAIINEAQVEGIRVPRSIQRHWCAALETRAALKPRKS